jgi:hypothetical protein
MAIWDRALNGISEFLAYPPEARNRSVLYHQVDVHIRHGAFGIGYPQVNNTYDPHAEGDGNQDHWILRNPLAFEVEYHEMGHAQLMSISTLLFVSPLVRVTEMSDTLPTTRPFTG